MPAPQRRRRPPSLRDALHTRTAPIPAAWPWHTAAWRGSSAGPVDCMHLQPGKIQGRQATHVDRDAHCAGLGVEALAEGRDPALRTIVVIDVVLIEAVAAESLRHGLKLQLRTRAEPEQTAAAATQRTVAVVDLGDGRFGLQIERDASAMTATGIVHVILLGTGHRAGGKHDVACTRRLGSEATPGNRSVRTIAPARCTRRVPRAIAPLHGWQDRSGHPHVRLCQGTWRARRSPVQAAQAGPGLGRARLAVSAVDLLAALHQWRMRPRAQMPMLAV
ncbi:hypothetical protein XAC2852_560144 [Xanthomonas citri pv. citri]|uniref:Uncharacterized protein n=1 Tax=Xanthomonas citri pv. citri TaxID=611301 RepID=A0A0U5FFE4_XANCI|nr:hypothetical protein XAC2852_560144 [Xanthomonas citri pv. citri]CEG17272.1 hypothetical protein XAC3562_610144 [Xanthomonas citri pv. citri]